MAHGRADDMAQAAAPARNGGDGPVIVVRDLVRRFGDFTAVASTSFEVARGEIFGLLGPNGAGKTTTFRMLCGLLPATSGHLEVAGLNLRTARAQARGRIGYVSQKFALYGNLTVRENLEFFGGAYGLRGQARRQRVAAMVDQFGLDPGRSAACCPAAKQRLAMAAGLLHEPEILFLDEPTSGIDRWRGARSGAPSPRWRKAASPSSSPRTSWKRRNTATASPSRTRAACWPWARRGRYAPRPGGRGRHEQRLHRHRRTGPRPRRRRPGMSGSGFLRRFLALLRKEVRQMLRDKSNMAVGLLLPAALILLFGYGLSFDVARAAGRGHGRRLARRARGGPGLWGTAYLAPSWSANMPEAEARLRAGEVDAIVRVPPDFCAAWRRAGRRRARATGANGSNSTTAQTLEGYVGGAIGLWSRRQAERAGGKPAGAGVEVVQRMWFNEAGISTWYLVPGLLVLVLTLIGAFLTSLLIAREWERGTLESLFVTPVRPGELVLAWRRTWPSAPLICCCACWRRASCSRCRCAARCSSSSWARCCT